MKILAERWRKNAALGHGSDRRTLNVLGNASLDLLNTGSLFLLIGFPLWFSLLGVDLISVFVQMCRHSHEAGFRFFSIGSSKFGLACGYAIAFFLGALLAARPRWSYRPALSAFLAYGAFLAVYLLFLNWGRVSVTEFVTLIAPLVTSPLGGLLGERLCSKGRNKY